MSAKDSESPKKPQQAGEAPGSGRSSDEELGEALRAAQVISAQDLSEALQQKKESGKSLMDLLKKKVTWQNLKEVVNYSISLSDRRKTLGDALVEGRWLTPTQLAEARLERGASSRGLIKALLDRVAVTQEQLAEAEKVSKQTGHSLWRTVINMGLVPEKVIAEILRSQTEQIGQILLKDRLITQDQLKQALETHETSGEKTGWILVKMGALKEHDLAKALAEQAGVPFIDLKTQPIDYEAAALFPDSLIRQFSCIPVRTQGEAVVVAFEDPNRISALTDVGLLIGVEVQPAIGPRGQVEDAISRYLSWRKERGATEAPPGEPLVKMTPTDLLTMKEFLDRAHVPRLVTTIIERAIKARASDIHLDPQDTGLRVRFRIDGLLQDVISLPPQLSSGVVTRLKIMANMNIVERRLPQDGHIHIELEGKEYDMRVASVKASLGEKMVLRLLVEENVLTGIAQLGLEEKQQQELDTLIRKPYGLLLATGPVGSGKTTTLYSCLNQVNILTRNVMTIEDPIEYKLRGTNQLEVNHKINFDFADGLRALLRQDPDIMMVGEIRDDETARIAIRAAMTGVLVFSTLHANDSASAVMALVHHGVPRFLISSAVIGIVSQRLVRKVCENCKEEYKPPLEVCLEMGMPREEAENFVGKRGAGCAQCFYTGYRGRTGVFEIMAMNEELADLVMRQASKDEIRRAAVASGMQTLQESALNKVRAGVTPPEQLFATVFM